MVEMSLEKSSSAIDAIAAECVAKEISAGEDDLSTLMTRGGGDAALLLFFFFPMMIMGTEDETDVGAVGHGMCGVNELSDGRVRGGEVETRERLK